jgi:hypothetical protein
MSDLATILDLQGLHAEALPSVRRGSVAWRPGAETQGAQPNAVRDEKRVKTGSVGLSHGAPAGGLLLWVRAHTPRPCVQQTLLSQATDDGSETRSPTDGGVDPAGRQPARRELLG